MTKSTNYLGNFVYEDNILKYILTSEGKIAIDEVASPDYQYFLKDHLGNTRVVFNSDSVLQASNYYPFGMLIENFDIVRPLTGNENKFLYNGKELQSDFGLDWYDYGARFYDAQIGRWHLVDPKAELARRWSPYNYTFNNPLRFIDPDGQFPGVPPTDWIASASVWLTEKSNAVARLATGTSGKIDAPAGMIPESTQKASKTIGTVQDTTTVAEGVVDVAKGSAKVASEGLQVTGTVVKAVGYTAAIPTEGASLALVPVGEAIEDAGVAIEIAMDLGEGNTTDALVSGGTKLVFGSASSGINKLKKAEKLSNTDSGILQFVNEGWNQLSNFIQESISTDEDKNK